MGPRMGVDFFLPYICESLCSGIGLVLLACYSYAYGTFSNFLFPDFESRPCYCRPVKTPKTASITGLFYPTKVN